MLLPIGKTKIKTELGRNWTWVNTNRFHPKQKDYRKVIAVSTIQTKKDFQ